MNKQNKKTMKEKQIKPTSGGKTYNNTKVDTSKRATQYRQTKNNYCCWFYMYFLFCC
jgi:regulatory protein YycI of two-component signal transduction system YycFG